MNTKSAERNTRLAEGIPFVYVHIVYRHTSDTKMKTNEFQDNFYSLLTPGSLNITITMKAVMLQDWCTWDDDYTERLEGLPLPDICLAQAADHFCIPPLVKSLEYLT
jgi:hypothetical protein